MFERKTFCFETVFSHPSKIDFVGQAKALGYEIQLVFVHLDSTQLNCARVAQRVSTGGHNVPSEKIEKRVPRLLENVHIAIGLCDQVRLLDNSYADTPFLKVATFVNGSWTAHRKPLSDWAKALIS
ncbi:MAG: putative ABC-type ATPase [Hyphomicrobiaceae bacterium]